MVPTPFQNEIKRIREYYAFRGEDPAVLRRARHTLFSANLKKERESVFASYLSRSFTDLTGLKVLEIGAGSGENIQFLHSLGIPMSNLYANELMENKLQLLQMNLPGAVLHIGNAMNLDYHEYFDVILQSTVFTSILDRDFKHRLAARLFNMLRPGGLMLWYDFVVDNPFNENVRGIPVREVRSLFPGMAAFSYRRVTLAPPIGRMVGKMYIFVNKLFPFLRTHIVAAIKK